MLNTTLCVIALSKSVGTLEEKTKTMKIAQHLPIDISCDLLSRFNKAHVPQHVIEVYFTSIKHGAFNKALEILHQCFNLSGFEAIGALILGEPGLGKSFVMRYFLVDIYSRAEFQATAELTPLPVLYIRVPGRPTINRVVEKLLETAGLPAPTYRSKGSALVRLSRVIREQGTRMIIFDECQHLLKEHALIRTNDVINFIKVVMDEHALSIVFAGHPNAKNLLAQFPEINQRLSLIQMELKAFSFDDTGMSNFKSFKSYIKTIQAKLSSLNITEIKLAEEGMYSRLWLATKGIPRHIHQLLTRILLQHSEGQKMSNKIIQEIYDTCPFKSHLGHFRVFTAPLDKVNTTARQFFEQQRVDIKKLKNKKVK